MNAALDEAERRQGRWPRGADAGGYPDWAEETRSWTPTALRALQAPIKERYKGDPKAAMITLKAKGTLDDADIACKVETGRALAVAGLHPATGGSGGAVLRRHAARSAGRLRRRDPEGGRDRARHPAQVRHVSAEGDLDFRGTLGVAKDAPVGFAQSACASTSTPTRRRTSSTSC